MPVELAAIEYPDHGFFAFKETGFTFEHLRPDVSATDFADGECLDTCERSDVGAYVGAVRFALAYVAIANDNNRSFFGTAVFVAVCA